MDKNPWRFWETWIFKMLSGRYIVYILYNKNRGRTLE